MIRVLLVDDEQLVLDTLTFYCHTTRDLRVVATAPDGQAALEALRDLDIDVVLADIHMPVMGGLELLKRMLAFDNPPVFIAMTAFDTDESMLRILANGGAGYIIKSARPEDYVAAVRDAMNGGTTVSPQAMTRLRGYLRVSDDHEEVRQRWLSLPETSRDILRELCAGKSNADIALALHFSESTIKKRISSLCARFGVGSRLALAVTLLNAHV